MDAKGLGLKKQILLAALECSGGDCQKSFTMEDLLVSAWKKDKQAWGLRDHEEDYPDSDKIQKEIGARGGGNKGMVDLGLFERAHRRVYRLTPAGLAAASTLQPSDPISREKAGRKLEEVIRQILQHPVFRKWLADPAGPKHFREAGHFWGIAPGMPAKTVRERVNSVEHTLRAASDFLGNKGVEEVTEQRGRILFDRQDIRRCLEFQAELKNRFARDLRLLDPEIEL